MSYYIVKNLQFKKKENRISCQIADSSVTDYEDKYIFSPCDDLYKGLNSADLDDKIAYLMYDVICGNIRCAQYKNLNNTFDFFEDYITKVRTAEKNNRINDLKFIYQEYKDEFNSWLVKDCLLKTKDNYYISKKTNNRTIWISRGREYAKSFNSKYVSNKTSLVDRGYEIEYIGKKAIL
jgi:hypothetical protein